MNKRELEQWLYGNDATPPTPAAIASALGLPFDDVADTTLLRTAARILSLRFTVAVLQDAFPADNGVQGWLDRHRKELDWMSARQALLAGRTDIVEELVIRTWNGRTVSQV